MIIRDIYDDGWDIPGGRLRKMDFNVPLERVVKRKVIEELGKNIRFKLGRPVVFMRHERMELLSDTKRQKKRIFAIGYQAKYLSGKIKLGSYVKKYKWINPQTFKATKYFKGGWLKGITEYQKFLQDKK